MSWFDDQNYEWEIINPRGCYADFKRLADGHVIKNVHAVGHIVYGIPHQRVYRFKKSVNRPTPGYMYCPNIIHQRRKL